jgi:ABC-type lipoprotein export system ATPase subunit
MTEPKGRGAARTDELSEPKGRDAAWTDEGGTSEEGRRRRKAPRRRAENTVNVIETSDLGKRYRHDWVLRECTLGVPAGHLAALVGPNGAGKTTLMQLSVGLTIPTTGTATVLGDQPAGSPAALDGIAFVAQDAPVYKNLSATDMIHLTRNLNRRFDHRYAKARLGELGIPSGKKAGKLSGGQLQVAGEVDELLACHRVLTGPAADADRYAGQLRVVQTRRAGAQAHLLVRTNGQADPVPPGWEAHSVSLEELVPVLIGAFAGAPILARELETGTFRYAWTQGFGRERLAIAKLVLLAVAVTAVAGAFSQVFTWFFRPFLAQEGMTVFTATVFDTRGVAFAA